MNYPKIHTQVSDALSSIPIAVDLKAKWSELSIEENYVPKIDMPEMCFKDHVIGMSSQNLNCELKLDGKTQKYSLLTNELMIMPAKQNFTINFDQAHVSKAIHLSHTLMMRNALELFGTDNYELIRADQVKDPLIFNIRRSLCIELKINPDGCEIYAQTMANALAVHLLSRYSTHTKSVKIYSGGLSPKKMKLVLSFINDNLQQKITLEDLASLVQLSQYHFCSAFKQSLGISPHKYVIQQRVERAKNLLKQSKLSISDISIMCGFTHQSHLHRHFKRLTGITPKVFRNS